MHAESAPVDHDHGVECRVRSQPFALEVSNMVPSAVNDTATSRSLKVICRVRIGAFLAAPSCCRTGRELNHDTCGNELVYVPEGCRVPGGLGGVSDVPAGADCGGNAEPVPGALNSCRSGLSPLTMSVSPFGRNAAE